jgi:3-oxoadipate enol-lactonase
MATATIDLAYVERGQGAALILVHGYPVDHTIWDAVAEQLHGMARVICPDLRGFGHSPATPGIYTMRLLADDLLRLMDRLGVEKATLAGHSMGGYISLAFAQAHPQRLAGLALVTSQAAADAEERRLARLQQAEQVERDGVAGVVEGGLARYSPDPAVRAQVHDLMLRADPQAVAGALRGMAARDDLTGLLSRLDVPALVIAGEEDELVAMRRSQETARQLPQGHLVVVPGGGHLPMLEAPALVAGALRDLVHRVEQTRTDH